MAPSIFAISDLPAFLRTPYSTPVIRFFVDRLCEAVESGLRNTAELSDEKYTPRTTEAVNDERKAMVEFTYYLCRDAKVEPLAIVGALVYIERVKSKFVFKNKSQSPLLLSLFALNPR